MIISHPCLEFVRLSHYKTFTDCNRTQALHIRIVLILLSRAKRKETSIIMTNIHDFANEAVKSPTDCKWGCDPVWTVMPQSAVVWSLAIFNYSDHLSRFRVNVLWYSTFHFLPLYVKVPNFLQSGSRWDFHSGFPLLFCLSAFLLCVVSTSWTFTRSVSPAHFKSL